MLETWTTALGFRLLLTLGQDKKWDMAIWVVRMGWVRLMSRFAYRFEVGLSLAGLCPGGYQKLENDCSFMRIDDTVNIRGGRQNKGVQVRILLLRDTQHPHFQILARLERTCDSNVPSLEHPSAERLLRRVRVRWTHDHRSALVLQD